MLKHLDSVSRPELSLRRGTVLAVSDTRGSRKQLQPLRATNALQGLKPAPLRFPHRHDSSRALVLFR